MKYASLVMLASKHHDFETDEGSVWFCLEGIVPADLFIVNLARPDQSYGLFMNRFDELVGLHQCAT